MLEGEQSEPNEAAAKSLKRSRKSSCCGRSRAEERSRANSNLNTWRETEGGGGKWLTGTPLSPGDGEGGDGQVRDGGQDVHGNVDGGHDGARVDSAGLLVVVGSVVAVEAGDPIHDCDQFMYNLFPMRL